METEAKAQNRPNIAWIEMPHAQPPEPFIGYVNNTAKETTELQNSVAALSEIVSIALGDIRTLAQRLDPVLRLGAPLAGQQCGGDSKPQVEPLTCQLTDRLRQIRLNVKLISCEVVDITNRLAV